MFNVRHTKITFSVGTNMREEKERKTYQLNATKSMANGLFKLNMNHS